jgi:hypothetical protein
MDSIQVTPHLFVDEAKPDTTLELDMYQNTPLFTSGLAGKCIGDPRWYTNMGTPPPIVSIKRTAQPALNVWTQNGRIYIENATSTINLYNLLGQRIGSYTPRESKQGLEVPRKGLYLLKTDNQTTRVLIP